MNHHKTSFKRRMGAAFTSLATAAALIVPLAGTAVADHTGATQLEVVEGGDANNPEGTAHDFIVEAQDENGDPVAEAIEISFEIVSGPNADLGDNGNVRDGECTTDSDDTANSGDGTDSDADTDTGQAKCSYTDAADGEGGTDTVRFFIDEDGDEAFDEGEPTVTTTKTWHGDAFAISIAPTSDSAAVGACNDFTVTVVDDEGNPVPGETVNIIRDHSDNTAVLDWCTPDTDGNDVLATDTPPATTEGDLEGEATPTDDDGQLTFGINSDKTGTETVQVFLDDDGNDDLDAGEPNAQATKTWTAGGAAGVSTLDAEPESDDNFINESHEITVTATNADGDGVPDVTVRYRIDSGPHAGDNTVDDTADTGDEGVWCITGNDGTCSDTYSSATAGTDSFTFWVNQTTGGTAGPDAGEPQDTVTKTWVAGPDNVGDVTIDCEDGTLTFDDDSEIPSDPYDWNMKTCVNPTEDPSETFTVTVVDDGDGDPIQGVTIIWTVEHDNNHESGDDEDDTTFEGGTGIETDAEVRCTTDADGQCSVTLTNATPEDGDHTIVRATVAGTSDSEDIQKVWEDREADSLTVTPGHAVNEIGTDHTVTATVLDQFGDPFETEVDFIVTGRNPSGTNGLDVETTDGVASFTYTDTGPTNSEGTDNIDVRVDGNDDETADSGWNGVGTLEDLNNIKEWLEDVTAADVAVEFETTGDDVCDSTLGDGTPGFDATWDDDEATNTVDDTHVLCASAKNADGDVLYGRTITFTSSGVGHFEDLDGNDVDSPHTVMIDETGYAQIVVHSTEAGEQTVTASIDDASDTASKTWEAGDARNIELTPPSQVAAPGGLASVTATVTDRFGNPVEGVDVDATESGPGAFRNGVNSGTTDANGQVVFEVETNDTESGNQTVTATIDDADGNVDCDTEGDTLDEGEPEGNCSDTATVRWVDVQELNKVDPDPTVNAGDVVCVEFEAVDANGDPVEDITVRVELTGANENADDLTVNTGPCTTGVNQSAFAEGTTDSNGIVSASYTADNAGTDTLEGWADLDGDNVQDGNEPSAIYTITVQEAAAEDATVRFAGEDRMHTAILASQDSFGDGEASAVVIARSDAFPDALAGAPLAVAKNAPLLLTPSPANWIARSQPEHLWPATQAEIERVLADGGTVYILGQTAAIGTATEDDIEALANVGDVVRLGGLDRFETAVDIADETDPSPDTIFIASGKVFADALAGGAAAVEAGAVIVLADEDAARNGVPNPETSAYLLQHQGATTWALGGPAAAAYPTADNEIIGASRLGTAVMISEQFFTDPTVAGIARADEFPDALSGGAHIGLLGGPLVLTNRFDLDQGWGSANEDAGAVTAYLVDNAASIVTGYLYGGTSAISAGVDAEVGDAIS
ncbi:MAG TPA: cell wall-binding repeat-containing protein [Nitriliruptorales bacterium]